MSAQAHNAKSEAVLQCTASAATIQELLPLERIQSVRHAKTHLWVRVEQQESIVPVVLLHIQRDEAFGIVKLQQRLLGVRVLLGLRSGTRHSRIRKCLWIELFVMTAGNAVSAGVLSSARRGSRSD